MRFERIHDVFGQHGAQRLGAAALASAVVASLAACNQPAPVRHTTEKAAPLPVSVPADAPGVFPADDLTLTGIARYGTIADANQIFPLQVKRYKLATRLDTATGAAPVYRLDVGGMPAPDRLAGKLGISGSPTGHQYGEFPIYEWSEKGLVYFPATGGYSFAPAIPRTSDESVAIASGRKLLVDAELLPDDSREQVEVSRAPFGLSIIFHRRLGGLSVYGSGTTVLFPPQGEPTVTATHRPVAGGSTYPLRSAAAAWAQATARGWFMADGTVNGSPGVIVLPAFSADQVELCYREAELVTVQHYLVPMYRFSDSKQHISLYTPALTAAWLS
jgi:hypothetical protein